MSAMANSTSLFETESCSGALPAGARTVLYRSTVSTMGSPAGRSTASQSSGGARPSVTSRRMDTRAARATPSPDRPR